MSKVNAKIDSLIEQAKNKEEINLVCLFKVFLLSRYFIVIFLVIGVFAGIFFAITSPKEYISTSKVLTEVEQLPKSNMGDIFGIRNIANTNSDQLTPDLYPQIIYNNDFLLKVSQNKYYFSTYQDSISLLDYFNLYEEKSLLQKFRIKIASILKGANQYQMSYYQQDSAYMRLTGPQMRAIKELNNRIQIVLNNRVITVDTKMQDPFVSAVLNHQVINHLINYLVDYKIEKNKSNKEFLESQLEKARKEYYTSQNNLASFRDNNRELISEAGKSKIQALQLEFNLSSSIYSNLSEQFEQAKIKLQESKPILTILEKPNIPIKESEPNLMKNAIVFGILGLFCGISLIVFKILLAFFRK